MLFSLTLLPDDFSTPSQTPAWEGHNKILLSSLSLLPDDFLKSEHSKCRDSAILSLLNLSVVSLHYSFHVFQIIPSGNTAETENNLHGTTEFIPADELFSVILRSLPSVKSSPVISVFAYPVNPAAVLFSTLLKSDASMIPS